MLVENTIAYSKYIKPAHLRTAGQKVVHIVFGFSNCNNTNKAIKYGMYIEGKETKVCKHLSEPRRCLKCQHFGHYVLECKADMDTCTRCNRKHRTTTCIATDKEDFKCTNCTGKEVKTHGAADRNCLTFTKEKEKLQERILENKYKYFPSSIPCTWCLLNQPEPHIIEQQHTWQQRENHMNTMNNNQMQQFTEQWQTVQYRWGHQPRPPTETQRRRGPIGSGPNEGATDNRWPTRPAQSTLDAFMRPTQTCYTQSRHQQEHQDAPWGDCDPNEQGPGTAPGDTCEHTPLSYVD
jgi:hypothetical protein